MTTTIRARVLSPGGWPIEHAVLTLTHPAGLQAGRAAADATGTASISGVTPGSYLMIVSAPGHRPIARNVLVTDAGLTLDDIVLTDANDRRLPERGIWDIDPVHSSIRVRAHHLGLASVHGRIAEFSGEVEVGDPVERSSVTVNMKAASIDTGNDQRDTHLRSSDFLHTDRYPDLTFRSTAVSPLKGDRWAIDGELNVRGVGRQVRLDTAYLGIGPDQWGGIRCAFHAVTDLRRDDFAVDWNQAVRIGIGVVGAVVHIELDIEIVRR
ncbi:MAG TPA: YceI family protein [Streptosporangiaceae bacterium]|nr:YceI family protein [Streptosporangiaceae bacterium]